MNIQTIANNTNKQRLETKQTIQTNNNTNNNGKNKKQRMPAITITIQRTTTMTTCEES